MRVSYRAVVAVGDVLSLLLVVCIGFAWAAEDVDVEALKLSPWWSQVQENIRGQEYEISSVTGMEGEVAYRAINRDRNLEGRFRERGVEIRPRVGEGWIWLFELVSFGREESMMPVAAVEPVAEGRRVEYRREGLVEWYENGERGIEQGFMVSEPPAGEGAVVLEGRVSGSLDGRAGESGGYVSFLDDGKELLRYGELMVEDAKGMRVPARLRLEGDMLAIVVEGEGSYPLYVDPLLTSPSWTAEGNQAGARFGVSVSDAGDVNGDGYGDVIVGAYLYVTTWSQEGAAFVYHGSASGLSTTPDWKEEGNLSDAMFGISVSGAGDVNGDGYSDVIVGASHYDNGQTNEGRAYVYHGSASGLSTTPDWTAESNQESAFFGGCVSDAGDVNNDGYGDVIVGADHYDGGQTNEGRAYAYYGSASGLSTSANWTVEANQSEADLGSRVSCAGDVNGDGYDDVIVGAWLYDSPETNEGVTWVYHGSASGLSTTPDWSAEGDQANARFGSAASSAGDVNGDGYDDVIVGASDYDNGEANEGRAYVYHGSASGLSATPDWTAESNLVGVFFGGYASSAGDVNGDGYSAVIVGATRYENGETQEGGAWVYYGGASGLSTTPDWSAEGNQAYASFGAPVSSAGDVNGDNRDEVIVGAYVYDNGEVDEGRAYVYHAEGPPLPISRAAVAILVMALVAVSAWMLAGTKFLRRGMKRA